MVDCMTRNKLGDCPPVSFIVPTYNEEDNIARCLESVVRQSYPKDKLEIIVVDGVSEDRTAEIAREIGARVVTNPKRGAQIGKALGIKNSAGEFVVLLDADNELVQNDWLERVVGLLESEPDVFGVESNYLVNPEDPAANRYCALLGLEYPLARRFSLLKNCAHKEDRGDYLVYTVKDGCFPVVGANGFIWRRKVLEKLLGDAESFDEGDLSAKAYLTGYRKIGNCKGYGIYHHHINTVWGFFKKRVRTGREFVARTKIKEEKEKAVWLERYSKSTLVFAAVYCLSVVGPLVEAIRGFIIDRDVAWFLHPLLSFGTVVIYGLTYIEHYLRPPKLFLR